MLVASCDLPIFPIFFFFPLKRHAQYRDTIQSSLKAGKDQLKLKYKYLVPIITRYMKALFSAWTKANISSLHYSFFPSFFFLDENRKCHSFPACMQDTDSTLLKTSHSLPLSPWSCLTNTACLKSRSWHSSQLKRRHKNKIIAFQNIWSCKIPWNLTITSSSNNVTFLLLPFWGLPQQLLSSFQWASSKISLNTQNLYLHTVDSTQ